MPFTFKLSQRLARMRSRAVFLTLAVLAGCEKPIAISTDPGGTAASQLVLSPRTVTLHTNQTVDLTAVGLTAIGDTATVAVTWSMTTGSVIDTSTSGGKHYGRYKAGTDTGTVKVIAHGHPGTSSDTSVVTVTAAPVAAVTVSPSSASLFVGQTMQLGATTTDSVGNVLSGRTVTWTSSNPSVATVNGSGLAGAVAVGSATITATSEGRTGTAVISVSNVPVATVSVSPASASVLAGQTVQLAATTRDASGNVLTGRSIVWTSSNGSVATVSGSGLVTGVTAGSATITATSEGQSGTGTVSVSNVPVATVTVSPASASVQVGQTAQLAATTRDGSGNVLTGRTIVWASGNGSMASVNGSGLVTGVTAGSATITATSEGQSGSAAMTVTSPAPAPPGAVTDLGISAVTDSSVTISFTEVTDGTGSPASYDVRFAVGTISWGSATEVSRGTCATPVAGTAIGTKRTCTVLGLAASTTYGIQLVAFRGTLGANAVFGALSNATSGTTAAGAPAPVATVVVSPGSASVGVGGTQQFTTTLKDASGNVLTGRTVTWTSSALSVATITGNGLVSALLAGTSTITATSEGKSGAASLTVTALPPPPAGWPHEPSGLSVWSDYGFGTAIPVTSSDVPLGDGSGWSSIYNGNGLGSIGTDLAAPASPPAVFQLKYPVGFTGGSSPSTLYHSLPNGNQVYAGFWWKPSNPWQGHASNVNKIAFLFPGNNGDMYLAMYGPPGGPYQLRVLPEFPGLPVAWYVPNVTQVAVALGQWHRIEWWVDRTAGVVRWWMDGQLIGDYSGVAFPSGGFSLFEFSSTWGGIGDSKTETDYYWFDHVHLSGH